MYSTAYSTGARPHRESVAMMQALAKRYVPCAVSIDENLLDTDDALLRIC